MNCSYMDEGYYVQTLSFSGGGGALQGIEKYGSTSQSLKLSSVLWLSKTFDTDGRMSTLLILQLLKQHTVHVPYRALEVVSKRLLYKHS